MRSPEDNNPSGEAPEKQQQTVGAVIQRLEELRRWRDVVEYPHVDEDELRRAEEEVAKTVERFVRSGALTLEGKQELHAELVSFLHDADPDEIPVARRLSDLRGVLQDDLEGTK